MDFLTFQEDQITNLVAKKAVAERIAAELEPGQTVGAGSGSTSFLVLEAIAALPEERRRGASFVATSLEVSWTLRRLGLPEVLLGEARLDWLFDGADAVDHQANLIKGRGGALLREKLLFASTDRRLVAVDPSKMVDDLSEGPPVPVEVEVEATELAFRELQQMGASEVTVRRAQGKDGPVITEHGGVILDCRFEEIMAVTEASINALPGVMENGIFWGYRPEIVLPR